MRLTSTSTGLTLLPSKEPVDKEAASGPGAMSPPAPLAPSCSYKPSRRLCNVVPDASLISIWPISTGGAAAAAGSATAALKNTVPSGVIVAPPPSGTVIGPPPSPATRYPFAVSRKPNSEILRSPLLVKAISPCSATTPRTV